MAKNIILISIIIIIVFLGLNKSRFQTSYPVTELKLNNNNYKIEVASTSIQKTTGLSNRKKLCSNCGMIFLFNSSGILPFWMKDTLIPLDMVWIDQTGKIVDIKTITETNSLKIIKNSIPAQYVLELNANDCQKINLKIGDIIQLPNFDDIKKNTN